MDLELEDAAGQRYWNAAVDGVVEACYLMTSIFTSITPVSKFAMLPNAEPDKSTIRPLTNGPLSLIFTMTLLLFFLFVTLTIVPNGNFL